MLKYIKKLIFDSSFSLIFIFCNNNAIAYSNIKVDQLASNSNQVCANYLNHRDAFLQNMKDSNKKKSDTQNKKKITNLTSEKIKPKPIYFGTQKEVLERNKEIREYEKKQESKIEQKKLAQKQMLYAAQQQQQQQQQQQKENKIRINQCLHAI